MIRTHLFITDQQRKRLKLLAHETERSLSELIRTALDNYLDMTDAIRAMKSDSSAHYQIPFVNPMFTTERGSL